MKKEQQPRKELSKLQTFSEYMANFLRNTHTKSVVEIGSDVQLRVATNLSCHCDKYYSVNFPGDTLRLERTGWYQMGKDFGSLQNVELKSGNAIELSKLVPHANVIILHNVSLELEYGDTTLMWKYRRGELKRTEKQWVELMSRFDQAEERGYREFLKVAKPGYIITFTRLDTDNRFMNFLTTTLKINPSKIERKELLYDGLKENWEAFIINNT